MTNKIVAFWIFFCLLSHSALGQCRCSEEMGKLVFSHEFDLGQKLIICGYTHPKTTSAEVESYADIKVINCQDNRILLSIEAEETPWSLNRFRIHIQEGQVIIRQVIRLPSEPGWQWAPHPFFEKRVACIDGQLVVSEWKNIFIIPAKTRVEIDDFMDVYENHFEKSGDPFDLPHKLVLCALNGSPRAERLLMSFPKDHPEIFDGAIAETYLDILEFYRAILKR